MVRVIWALELQVRLRSKGNASAITGCSYNLGESRTTGFDSLPDQLIYAGSIILAWLGMGAVYFIGKFLLSGFNSLPSQPLQKGLDNE